MTRRSSAFSIAALMLLAAGMGARTQAPQQPSFRYGIELVLVDVTVLSRDGAPVTSLEPADFLLTVDKRPRRIHSVQLVASAGAGNSPAGYVTAGALSQGPRSFILVIDREHIPSGEGQEMLAAAARFVDSLGPDDRVALWTTVQTNPSVDFSETRESIKRRIQLAVGAYRPPYGPWNVTLKEALDADARAFGGTFTWVGSSGSTETLPLSLKPIIERECDRQPDSCPKQVQNQVTELARDARQLADAELANLRALLETITPFDGPKHVVLVTGGPVMTAENASIIHTVGMQAALARATVHALQIRHADYQARTDQMRASAERVDQSESAAYALAGVTGGLALTPVSGEIAFARLSRELSAGYLVAFETEPTDRDGKAHAIEVNVRDRGWGTSVRARKTFRVDSTAAAQAVPGIGHVSPQPAPSVKPPEAPGRIGSGEPATAKPVDAANRPADTAPVSRAPTDPAVDRVVRRMADYVAGYGPQASVFVGVEDYTQQVWVEGRYGRPRSLVAEFAIVKAAGRSGWAGFRDVVEVDGQDVSDRRDRLLNLLTGPAGGESELRRLSDESARYNVGPVIRNFNVPTTALFFFHPDLVRRFAFERKGTRTVGGVSTWELEFRETHRPTLVMKRDGSDVPCDGTVWVDPNDGTVVRTRLRLRNFADLSFMKASDRSPADQSPVAELVPISPPVQNPVPQTPPQQGSPPPQQTTPPSTGTAQRTTVPSGHGDPSRPPRTDPEQLPQIVDLESLVDIEVTYRRDVASGVWLPTRMSEVYEGPIPRGTKPPVAGRTVGTARYSDFKRFDTSVKIVVPK